MTPKLAISIAFVTVSTVLTACKQNQGVKNESHSFLSRLENSASVSTTFEDFKCNEILIGGTFSFDNVRFNEKYRYYFYDYIYQSNFQSQEDVINSGLSLDIPVDIGETIGITGHFDQKKYNEWRSQYEHQRTTIESKDAAFESLKKYADTSVTNNWLRCKYLQSRQQEHGLQLLIEDAGPENVIFSASFDPLGDYTSTKIKGIEITGGTINSPSSSPFKKGNKIGPGGVSTFVKRDPSKQLDIILSTTQGTKHASFAAPTQLSVLFFDLTNDTPYKGDTTEIKWSVVGATSVKLNNENVNASGSKKVVINSDSAFTLTASGNGTPISVIKRVNPSNKPIVLKGIRINLSAPAWTGGNGGKDKDTHMVFKISNSQGHEIASYDTRENKYKPLYDNWQINSGDHSFDINFKPSGEKINLRKDLFNQFNLSVIKYPNGKDKVTLDYVIYFTFSDNSIKGASTNIKMLDDEVQGVSLTLNTNNR
jgi:hypothetical protein